MEKEMELSEMKILHDRSLFHLKTGLPPTCPGKQEFFQMSSPSWTGSFQIPNLSYNLTSCPQSTSSSQQAQFSANEDAVIYFLRTSAIGP